MTGVMVPAEPMILSTLVTYVVVGLHLVYLVSTKLVLLAWRLVT